MPRKLRVPYSNSVATPIYRNVTFSFTNTQEVIDYHRGRVRVGRYGRYDNPNWLEVECKLAQLDCADAALMFPSGMSAITTTLFALLEQRQRLGYTSMGYRNINTLCGEMLTRFGVEAIPLDLADTTRFQRDLQAAAAGGIAAVFIETPTNPAMLLADLDLVRDIVGPDTLVIVDSTLASPANFQPLLWGADLVVHSASKYLSGHGDLLAGSVAGRRELIERIRVQRNVTGAICDPQAAVLLNRSLATFPMRMRAINESGMALAMFLDRHPKIRRVHYTGLRSHPQAALAQRYLAGHGGVVSFELDGNTDTVAAFVDRLQVPFMGTHFGSVHSMVEQPRIFTYYHHSDAECCRLGIAGQLIRYSLGFEDTHDIINDMEAALVDV